MSLFPLFPHLFAMKWWDWMPWFSFFECWIQIWTRCELIQCEFNVKFKCGNPVKLFKTLKDEATKVLHSVCQQTWKTQQWPQNWKRSILIPIPKKCSTKECSNHWTIALIFTVKASAYDVGDLGSIPGSGRSPGEGNGNPLQYSCLENPTDGGAW